ERRTALLTVVALLLCTASSLAQASTPAAMSVRFIPGQSTRYEVDAIVHMTSEHSVGVKLNVPEECSYRLQSVLQFDFERLNADGALNGLVHFQGVRYEGPPCAVARKAELDKALQNVETDAVRFD